MLKINEKRRTPEQSHMISEQLSLVEQLESCFTKSQFSKFGQVAWYDSFGPCRVLIRQGQFADCFYLVLSGKVSVKTNSGDSSLLGPGDVFGLEELIQDELAPQGSSKFKEKVRMKVENFVFSRFFRFFSFFYVFFVFFRVFFGNIYLSFSNAKPLM